MDENGQRAGPGTYLLWAACIVVLLYLAAPVIIIAIVSFDQSRILNFPPKDIGTLWYRRVLSDPGWMHSLWVSIQVGIMATVGATTLGFLAAFALVRSTFRHKVAIYGFILTPMIVPNVIVAIAFYMAFARLGAANSLVAMALGHTVLALPLTTIILTASLQGVDERYERAALSLGATPFQMMRKITLPLAMPGLISAALFAFLTSFDELLISLFLSGVNTQTTTVRIWNSLANEVEPTIAAISTLLIGMTVVILGLNAVFQRGPSR
ncbi:ABC transporter permease [Mesorhizobium sp. A623]